MTIGPCLAETFMPGGQEAGVLVHCGNGLFLVCTAGACPPGWAFPDVGFRLSARLLIIAGYQSLRQYPRHSGARKAWDARLRRGEGAATVRLGLSFGLSSRNASRRPPPHARQSTRDSFARSPAACDVGQARAHKSEASGLGAPSRTLQREGETVPKSARCPLVPTIRHRLKRTVSDLGLALAALCWPGCASAGSPFPSPNCSKTSTNRKH